MKTLILAFAISLAAASAHAGIDITWRNCPLAAAGEPAPASGQDFDCTGSNTYTLYGCFKSDVSLPEFYWLDVSLRLQWFSTPWESANQPMQPFWRLENGGCNRAGISVGIDLEAASGSGTRCSEFATPWGEHGEEASIALYAYGPDFGGPGFAAMVFTVARPAGKPFPIVAGTRYFGFALNLRTDLRATCAGCTNMMAIAINNVTLISSTPTGEPFATLNGSELTRDHSYIPFVAINAPDLLYGADPVLARTWGQIKSQYR